MAANTQHAQRPTAEPPAVLYVGRVMHRRLRPFGHRFSYRVFSMLIDIDRIAEAASGSRIFSYNRFNLFGYDDRDHGPRRRSDPSAPSLRDWVEQQLAAAGIEIDGGRIRLLCFPRVLGYVFNPLSIFFCHRHDGELAAILYEVHNTFGESHVYAFRIDPAPSVDDRTGGSRPAVLTHAADKAFHVSPFIDMTPRYRFRLRPPGDRLSILIREGDAKGDLLLATLHGTAAPFGDKTLTRLFLTHPLMSLKVIGAIHWQALKLWSKGARYHPRPRSTADERHQT
ncbi:DUF1365 domain-containing protein [Fodinicurvata sp. EGI_FJ10296]|uniref:DUF1365 domain-containing protein n=1 Tax=Fodinicurvata sp. EGI_FJ10296 TaxID=3231908 RepID=UPI00345361FC